MGSHRRTTVPSDLAGYSPHPSEVRDVLQADVRCYMCGSTCGELESEVVSRLGQLASFRPHSSQEAELVDWRRLRCPRCGGRTYLDEMQRVRKRSEQIDWRLDAPRRGRPPQWLVELRTRDAA